MRRRCGLGVTGVEPLVIEGAGCCCPAVQVLREVAGAAESKRGARSWGHTLQRYNHVVTNFL